MTMKEALAAVRSKAAVPIPVAAIVLDVSRNSGYEGAKRGDIPVIEIGNRKSVPTAWLREKLGIQAEAA